MPEGKVYNFRNTGTGIMKLAAPSHQGSGAPPVNRNVRTRESKNQTPGVLVNRIEREVTRNRCYGHNVDFS